MPQDLPKLQLELTFDEARNLLAYLERLVVYDAPGVPLRTAIIKEDVLALMRKVEAAGVKLADNPTINDPLPVPSNSQEHTPPHLYSMRTGICMMPGCTAKKDTAV